MAADFKIEAQIRAFPQEAREYLGSHIRDHCQDVLCALEEGQPGVAMTMVRVLLMEMDRRFGL